jgi:tetratricopeptide (TPR) repeat protein
VLPVLNLDNLSSNPSLTESIAASLQVTSPRFGGARVTTEPAFTGSLARLEDVRKTARAAKARGVLMTTEREIRGKRRITFRLLDSATGEPLCRHLSEEIRPEDFRRPVSEQTTRKIIAALTAKDRFNPAVSDIDPGLHNDVALTAIAAGRDLFSCYTTSDYDRAIALFKKAILAEPNSSIAHAYLAIAASARTHYNSDRRFLELAQAEANQAVRLAPESPDAHRALAGVYYQKGRFSDALEEQLKTIEIGGLEERAVSFAGLTLDMLGRCDQALEWYRVASKLEGKPGQLDALIGDCLTKLCDDEAALEAYKRAGELRPDRPQGAIGICHTRLLQGKAEQAREILRAGHWSNIDEVEQIAAQVEFFDRRFDVAVKLYTNLVASDPDGGGTFYGSVSYRSALGRAKQGVGDYEAGKALLEECLVQETTTVSREPTNPEAAYRLGAVETSLGILQSGYHHLREAVNLGWVDYRSLALDPRFDSLRSNPEFESIIKGLSVKMTEMKRKSRNPLGATTWIKNK